jgi:hypothetical protein
MVKKKRLPHPAVSSSLFAFSLPLVNSVSAYLHHFAKLDLAAAAVK